MADQEFPVDDATLILLAEACRINPDTGRSHLMEFLSLGERVKSRTLLTEEDDPGIPIVEVTFEEGYAPWSPQSAILALIAEIQRLRAEAANG